MLVNTIDKILVLNYLAAQSFKNRFEIAAYKIRLYFLSIRVSFIDKKVQSH